MNSDQIAQRLEDVGNMIWADLSISFENEAWLDWNGLPDEALQSMTIDQVNLTLLGQNLRGLANTCFSRAADVRRRSELIDSSPQAAKNYERLADFAFRSADKFLSEFKTVRDDASND